MRKKNKPPKHQTIIFIQDSTFYFLLAQIYPIPYHILDLNLTYFLSKSSCYNISKLQAHNIYMRFFKYNFVAGLYVFIFFCLFLFR